MSTRSRIWAALLAAPVAALLALSGLRGAPAGPGAANLSLPSPPPHAAPTGVQEFVGPVLGAGPVLPGRRRCGPAGPSRPTSATAPVRAENFTGTLTGDTAPAHVRRRGLDPDGEDLRRHRDRHVVPPGQGRPGDFAGAEGARRGRALRLRRHSLRVPAGAGSPEPRAAATRRPRDGSRRGNTATGTITLASGGTPRPLDPMAGKSPDAVNDFEAYRVLIADDGSRRGNPKPGAPSQGDRRLVVHLPDHRHLRHCAAQYCWHLDTDGMKIWPWPPG